MYIFVHSEVDIVHRTRVHSRELDLEFSNDFRAVREGKSYNV